MRAFGDMSLSSPAMAMSVAADAHSPVIRVVTFALCSFSASWICMASLTSPPSELMRTVMCVTSAAASLSSSRRIFLPEILVYVLFSSSHSHCPMTPSMSMVALLSRMASANCCLFLSLPISLRFCGAKLLPRGPP